MFSMTRVAMAAAIVAAAPGQVVFASAGSSSWTVPVGVTSISMVAVQAHGNAAATSVTVDGVTVCRALNGSRIGDGGGDGGNGGAYVYSAGYYYPGGSGGAGGYSGNGGSGGSGDGTGYGGSGSGGGGGGGGNGSAGGPGTAGGGVGLRGQGASGPFANPFTGGKPGSSGTGTQFGGGPANSSATANGTRGGALAYKNNVAVTPGQSISIAIGAAGGAVRIIWGAGRAYPSTNTADV